MCVFFVSILDSIRYLHFLFSFFRLIPKRAIFAYFKGEAWLKNDFSPSQGEGLPLRIGSFWVALSLSLLRVSFLGKFYHFSLFFLGLIWNVNTIVLFTLHVNSSYVQTQSDLTSLFSLHRKRKICSKRIWRFFFTGKEVLARLFFDSSIQFLLF